MIKIDNLDKIKVRNIGYPRLMYKNSIVAYANETVTEMIPVEGIPEWQLHFEVFRGKSQPAGIEYFDSWARDRIFPENREGIEEILDDMNISKYVPEIIFIFTQCRRVTDYFWADFLSYENPIPIREETEEDVKARIIELESFHERQMKRSEAGK